MVISVSEISDWIDNSSGDAASDLVTAAEAAAVGWIETLTGRRIRHQTSFQVILDGVGVSGPLYLPSMITHGTPATNLVLHKRSSLSSDWELYDSDDYELDVSLDYNVHTVHLKSDYFPLNKRAIRATYQTGYGTGTGEASPPEAIKLALKEIITIHWRGRIGVYELNDPSDEDKAKHDRIREFVLPVLKAWKNPYKEVLRTDINSFNRWL